eukprot:7389065-Prymnesium_polylepis.1
MAGASKCWVVLLLLIGHTQANAVDNNAFNRLLSWLWVQPVLSSPPPPPPQYAVRIARGLSAKQPTPPAARRRDAPNRHAGRSAKTRRKKRDKRISRRDHVGMCGMCRSISNLTIVRMPQADMSTIRCWPPSNPSGANGRAALTIYTMAYNLSLSFMECLTHKNRLAYAQRHGYEYCLSDAPPTNVVMNNAWHKLVAVQGLLRQRPRRPAVFFMDADALLMNMD